MNVFDVARRLVGKSGLETPTSRLSCARSNQLSYAPVILTSPYYWFSIYLKVRRPSNSTVVHRTIASVCSSPEIRLPALRGGGDDGIRTHDPLLAGQVLSQLSYTPILGFYLFGP